MAQPIKHKGPYKVLVIDGKFEVVERIQPDIYIDPPIYEQLRPRKRYTVKQGAYALADRLNKKS